jgi:hypothetical protein
MRRLFQLAALAATLAALPAAAQPALDPAALAAIGRVLSEGRCAPVRDGRACFSARFARDGQPVAGRPEAPPFEAAYLTVVLGDDGQTLVEAVLTHERWLAPDSTGARLVQQTFVFLYGPRAGATDGAALRYGPDGAVTPLGRDAGPEDRAAALAAFGLAREAPDRLCLPPGAPRDLAALPDARIVSLRASEDPAAPRALAVFYRHGLADWLIGVWFDGRLVAVDDDPDGPTPAWIDHAALHPLTLTPLPRPWGPCHWQRAGRMPLS